MHALHVPDAPDDLSVLNPERQALASLRNLKTLLAVRATLNKPKVNLSKTKGNNFQADLYRASFSSLYAYAIQYKSGQVFLYIWRRAKDRALDYGLQCRVGSVEQLESPRVSNF